MADRSGPVARLLADGRRLHLQHGPIDLVIEAWGSADEVDQAYRQAMHRFETVLPELVGELPVLRARVGRFPPRLNDPVAARMSAAVWPYRRVFITPMAAVAGAVADEILAALLAGRSLEKAYVNDGGDIAIHLTEGQTLRAGIVGNVDVPALDGFADIDFASPIRGLATSGWRGRSFSLGIADSVTVLATSGAAADAAATVIANTVDIDHAAIERAPASTIQPDTDLGDLPVTTAVGTLPIALRDQALLRGAAKGESLRRRGLIAGAALSLQGSWRVVGDVRHGRLGHREEAR